MWKEKLREVENTVKTSAVKRVKKESAKGDAALGDSTKKTVKSENTNAKTHKESDAAKERVERALHRKKEEASRKEERAKKKAEKKAARDKWIADRKAAIEKRMAERKERAEKRAAARKALAEKRAAEREAAMRERAHAKANRHQKNARKKTNNRKNNEERKSREKGYGGWIAAVVALGAVSLALATTVTVGAIEMKNMNGAMMSAQRGTMYELTGIMEHVDDDLDRARISASEVQQSRILTDLLVQARLAEADLEKLSIPMENTQNVTDFINRTARESERMLVKLRNGGTLSENDIATLESLYKTNHSIRAELDKMLEKMTDKDWSCYMKNGEGMISEVMDRLEKTTLEENRAALERKMDEIKGAGTQRNEKMPEEKSTATIDTVKAEELCQKYFSKYNVDEFQCFGETVTKGYATYNVQGYDGKGMMLFAEIDKNSGDLLRFDYYEECTAKNFDSDNAARIAEEFLQSLGYEDMTIARFSENGSTAYFTFVYQEDGVAYYPDEVRVKVCCTRGVVSGMDATKYLQNHRGRDALNVKINMETAYNKLSKKLSVEAARLAVVDTARGERPAYEFLCTYEEQTYFVYLDAETGEEIAIINVANLR